MALEMARKDQRLKVFKSSYARLAEKVKEEAGGSSLGRRGGSEVAPLWGQTFQPLLCRGIAKKTQGVLCSLLE